MFEILLVIGLVALVGFASRWVFERTRVPEVIILLCVGLALGPLGLLAQFSITGINLEGFLNVAPIAGAIAIVSLVFEAGLRLKLENVSKNIVFSVAFAVASFAACVAALTALLHFGLGWNLTSSLLLAAVLGGPSSQTAYALLPFVRTNN